MLGSGSQGVVTIDQMEREIADEALDEDFFSPSNCCHMPHKPQAVVAEIVFSHRYVPARHGSDYRVVAE